MVKKCSRKKTVKTTQKGDRYICSVCGLMVTVDNVCGCLDACDIICCGKEMQLKK